MAYKLVTTRVKGHIVSVLLDEKERLIEVHPFVESNVSLIGNIYVGQVKTVKSNINSAFVDIGLEENVFVSLGESNHVHYAKKNGKKAEIVQGDQILVQIQKDAHKTKLAKAVTDFSITGKYIVLTTDKSAAFISSKITNDERRLELKHMLRKYLQPEYGFIARTNCENIEDDFLIEEMNQLAQQYAHILSVLPFRAKGQKLFVQDAPYMSLLKELYDDEVILYMYDDLEIFNSVKDYVNETLPEMAEKLVFKESERTYEVQLNLETKVAKLLQKKVWLKSGASLIIEPTEALTVIDVNTEKTLSKKSIEETIFKTNMEAAQEIMYQIRARNLSGIIIVDFIDMKEAGQKKELLKKMTAIAIKDPQKTTIIGMTNLGLVEITRKKRKPTLKEQWLL